MKDDEIKKAVRDRYGRIAERSSKCSCCGGANDTSCVSEEFGYHKEELDEIPEGANLGLGCGNPVAFAQLRKDEVVLDMGSGAGIDCFFAANMVGENGKVIGIDMTPEMIEKARENARDDGYENVEFRLGEIENLPVADGSVDTVISNCVINLVPDKKVVFDEVFRVLKPGGRILISDIVLLKDLPDAIADSILGYVGCISGAIKKEEYLTIVGEAGFSDIRIIDESFFPIGCVQTDGEDSYFIDKEKELSPESAKKMEKSVLSITVQAIRPP